MVHQNQKSWFVRQKVLGANIHETEGLLKRNQSQRKLVVLVDVGKALAKLTEALGANIHETEGLFERNIAVIWKKKSNI